jgi:hypothetical protein
VPTYGAYNYQVGNNIPCSNINKSFFPPYLGYKRWQFLKEILPGNRKKGKKMQMQGSTYTDMTNI